MATIVALLLVSSLLVGIAIESSICESDSNVNGTTESTIHSSEPKCLHYLDQVRQELGSTIPPINDSKMTDNYYNISRALYPSVDLPALYVKVTLQFLNDYQNGTKTIDDEKKKKFTWSKACSFVSVKHISLLSMSIFSLSTICPQRRETELTVTVPPFCKDSPYAQDDDTSANTWRYIVSTIEDITVNPIISDPRVNTVACVVEGQEGDDSQPIKYPKGTKWDVAWIFCWFVLAASFFTSGSIWFFLHYCINEAFKDFRQECSDKAKNKDKEIEKKKTRRAISGTILKMAVISAPFAVVVVIAVFVVIIITNRHKPALFAYSSTYLILLIISFCVGCVWNCRRKLKEKDYFFPYKAGFNCLFLCLFQTVHHLLWVVCGILSEPYWATPIFLIGCLFVISILYAIFLYEKELEFVTNGETETDSVGSVMEIQISNQLSVAHLVMCWISFVLILITIALMAVGNGHALDNPTAGIIESVLIFLFLWLVKKSNLRMCLTNEGPKKKPPNIEEEATPLTTISSNQK